MGHKGGNGHGQKDIIKFCRKHGRLPPHPHSSPHYYIFPSLYLFPRLLFFYLSCEGTLVVPTFTLLLSSHRLQTLPPPPTSLSLPFCTHLYFSYFTLIFLVTCSAPPTKPPSNKKSLPSCHIGIPTQTMRQNGGPIERVVDTI